VTTFPTSFAQRRLWFLQQLEPGSPAYNIPEAYRLRGPLEAGALELALQEVARRHEMLRTRFALQGAEPVQVVEPAPDAPLPIADLTGVPEPSRDDAVRMLADEDARRPHDLASGPPLRARLLRLRERDHVLLVNVNHIAADEWSMGIFHRELGTLYDAFAAGRPSPLAPPALQYGDFAAWEREWLVGDALREEADHWRGRLAGVPTVLELPADRPRPAVQGYAGGVHAFHLPADLARMVVALGTRHGASPFMTLLAAFGVLLARHAGHDQVLIGSPVANRDRVELEEVIGLFLNLLPIRIDLRGRPSFSELLTRTRDAALDAFEHRDLPFDVLVEELRLERNLGRAPLVQAQLSLGERAGYGPRLAGIDVEALPVYSRTAKLDLALAVTTGAGAGMDGLFEYRTDLFDSDTVARTAGQFRTLVEAAVEHPERRVAELPLLPEAQRRQLLVEWNRTAAPEPDACVPELFEAQAARTPGATAVSCGQQAMTYAELNARANRFADLLRRLVDGPEAVVALGTPRGIDFVAGLLGILKAGAVFLPLDPAAPARRRADLLERSRCRVLVGAASQRPAIGATLSGLATPPATLWFEDLDDPTLSEAEAQPAAGPRGLAYVMFTSGSTGVPKGAMIEHRGLRNHIRAKSDDLGLTAADVLAQNGPATFDIVVWQCLAPLLLGGRVHVVPDEAALDPVLLCREVERAGVTVLQLVPSMLGALLDAGPAAGALDRLRWAVPTGDALPTELVARWLAAHPHVPLLNTYGLTECSDDQCHRPIHERPNAGWPPVAPIGRPVRNLRAYVLDGDGQPVPAGVPGELHLAGAGVSRGYLGRPDLTAERFLPDPFSPEPGGRAYRTGDLVRHRAGELEYVGRLDDMVKIRGVRVEPAEVETALTRHPAVREAVVVARPDSAGSHRLVAYVVMEGDGDAAAGELREFLRERLPEALVPAAVVALPALPLTVHGKIDRRSLPEPPDAPARHSRAPRTATEEALAEIYAGLLGRERVGVDDGFFELGGHSLLAIQLVSRVRDRLRVELPLAAVFHNPTVAALAVAADSARRGQDVDLLDRLLTEVESGAQ
jgi:amino acid adenylation domain-containing protein